MVPFSPVMAKALFRNFRSQKVCSNMNDKGLDTIFFHHALP